MKPIYPSWSFTLFAVLALYPLFPAFDQHFFAITSRSLGGELPGLFLFATLALALNVVVGYTGLLHLGIAAFFGIGAYVVGITTAPANPFGLNFWLALLAAGVVATASGFLLGAPALRLRGDYLALVTLGFAEVVRFLIKNLPTITEGTRSISPLPPPSVPMVTTDWNIDYRPFYYLALVLLTGVFYLLYRLEHSKLGRAWIAIREDELAAQCMGLNTARLKLTAFAVSAGIAGLAGGIYAAKMTSTVGPEAYDFNKSIFVLCCLILGGLGSRNGALLGVFLLYGFDYILSPIVDGFIQAAGGGQGKTWQTFSGWRLIVFGLVLIIVMRVRPQGLLPNDRVSDELKHAPAANN
jgi:branched-chain amino acid transport system permease protein